MGAAGDAILKLLLIGEDKSASAALGKVATKAKETGDKAKASLGGIGSAMGALGGLAAAAGVAKFGNDAINAFKDVGTESIKLSRLTGLNVEDSSRLRFAFQQTGVDGEQAGKAIGIFSKNLASGTAEKALAGLGLSAKDSSGHLKSMQDLLPGVADKFKTMPDGPEKTALAMKLFGKSGADLLPFLNKGADGIKALDDASDKYGLTVSGPMADNIKKAKASQKDWDATVQGLSVTFGAVLLPVLTTTLGYVRDNVVPIIQNATAFMSRHADTIGHVIQVVGPIVGIIVGVIAAIKTWTIVQGILNTVMALNPVGLIIIAIAALAAGLIYAYQHSDKFREICDTAFRAIGAIVTWVWNNALQPFIKMMVEGIVMMIGWVANLLEVLGKVPGFEWARDAAVKIRGAQDAVQGFADSIKKIPENTTANVKLNVTANYNAATATALNIAAGNANAGHRASGGPVSAGASYIVGENGPELFNPSQSGMVYNASQTASMLSGSPRGINGSSDGGGNVILNVTVQGDSDPLGAAKKIEQHLRLLKMNRGGRPLAFI
jgi:hypothetical protein